ncbi:hypothetical protein EV663_10236 [Rhodovulum bhavnagarense]|uniref:Phage abortive infection protein n=1 Tax=Rhodovulum bhavnagarense TaxID=992286 RepID=A0A4R2RGV4_9RHOB|nr:hypothetical protein [Rhodovulum bhavnagarense]TCP62193.1 hypothetical protein EV663_10236 [Rhodovulum bhavnagarense]
MEIIKIVISLVTPITVAFVGYFLNQRLKSIDNAQWQSRKIVEKRLELYDQIAPDLNLMLCFCTWVGYWKEISPKQMLEAKRSLDKTVNIYKHLLSDEFYILYGDFIHTIFQTYTGHGKDALIKSEVANSWGDRTKHANYEWEEGYNRLFTDVDLPNRREVFEKYDRTMNALRDCIGIESQNGQRL